MSLSELMESVSRHLSQAQIDNLIKEQKKGCWPSKTKAEWQKEFGMMVGSHFWILTKMLEAEELVVFCEMRGVPPFVIRQMIDHNILTVAQLSQIEKVSLVAVKWGVRGDALMELIQAAKDLDTKNIHNLLLINRNFHEYNKDTVYQWLLDEGFPVSVAQELHKRNISGSELVHMSLNGYSQFENVTKLQAIKIRNCILRMYSF